MGDVRSVYVILRRGLGHAGEIWFVTQLMQWFGIYPELNRQLEAHLGPYALIIVAATALYELLQTAIQPNLELPCNDASPMLNLEDEK